MAHQRAVVLSCPPRVSRYCQSDADVVQITPHATSTRSTRTRRSPFDCCDAFYSDNRMGKTDDVYTAVTTVRVR